MEALSIYTHHLKEPELRIIANPFPYIPETKQAERVFMFRYHMYHIKYDK